MGANLSLIPELEDIVQHGSQAKRGEILQRITALFLDGTGRYNEAQVDLFDDVFSLLIDEIESKARAELSRRLAPLPDAPAKVLGTLAKMTTSPSPRRCSNFRRGLPKPIWSISRTPRDKITFALFPSDPLSAKR